MTKAIDPFEEFLRKKKVELLEQKYRDQRDAQESAPKKSVDPDAENPDEDPEQAARLKEEMDDFFQSGQSAGAEFFHKVKDLSDEKVDEIKDALDDVFEEESAGPETVPEDADAGDTFVNFFKQVQEEYDEDEVCDDASCLPLDEEAPSHAPPVPPPPAPTPAPPPAAARRAAPAPVPAPPPAPAREPEVTMPGLSELEAAAAEITTEEVESVKAVRTEMRLDLTEILLAGEAEEDLPRKLEVLCRIISKLVERSDLPESEIVEALIKSGVEF